MNKLCTSLLSVCVLVLRISTISPVVGGQASVTSGWVDWAGVRWCIPASTHPFCFPPRKGGIEEEGEKETDRQFREGLFVRSQEQSGLEAITGQPGPQREKKRAFNMGTGTADISTLRRSTEWTRERDERREEECSRCERETVNSEEDLKPLKVCSNQAFKACQRAAASEELCPHASSTHITPPSSGYEVMMACRWYASLSSKPFLGFKGWITVKWCNFLYLPGCSNFFLTLTFTHLVMIYK